LPFLEYFQSVIGGGVDNRIYMVVRQRINDIFALSFGCQKPHPFEHIKLMADSRMRHIQSLGYAYNIKLLRNRQQKQNLKPIGVGHRLQKSRHYFYCLIVVGYFVVICHNRTS
jgi:hypothetical protein